MYNLLHFSPFLGGLRLRYVAKYLLQPGKLHLCSNRAIQKKDVPRIRLMAVATVRSPTEVFICWFSNLEDAAENVNWAVELLSSRRVILSATAAASCNDFRLPGIRDENPVEVSMVAPWENFPFFHLKMFWWTEYEMFSENVTTIKFLKMSLFLAFKEEKNNNLYSSMADYKDQRPCCLWCRLYPVF